MITAIVAFTSIKFSTKSIQSIPYDDNRNDNDDMRNNMIKKYNLHDENIYELFVRKHSNIPMEISSSTTTRNKSTELLLLQPPPTLQLQVPYYIYDNIELNWYNATLDHNLSYHEHNEWYKYSFSHSEDYWLLQAAYIHPMRTLHPDKAKLFYVPIMLNALVEHHSFGNSETFCITNTNDAGSSKDSKSNNNNNNNNNNQIRCSSISDDPDGKKLLDFVDEQIRKSLWYQRNHGYDHVVVISHYNTRTFLRHSTHSNIRSCNFITYENHVTKKTTTTTNRRRIDIPSFNVGHLCPNQRRRQMNNNDDDDDDDGEITTSNIVKKSLSMDATATHTDTTKDQRSDYKHNDNNKDYKNVTKLYDFIMVASLHPERQLFESRRNICKWLARGNYSTFICGKGEACLKDTAGTTSSISYAKYGFHVRGDTYGSSRLISTLISNTVPIFTDIRQYEILPYFIPWHKISVFVNISSFDAFQQSMDSLLSQPESFYREKLSNIQQYHDIFDFTTIFPFDRYMSEFARRIYGNGDNE